jgi:hypothetical protein
MSREILHDILDIISCRGCYVAEGVSRRQAMRVEVFDYFPYAVMALAEGI